MVEKAKSDPHPDQYRETIIIMMRYGISVDHIAI